MSELEKIQRSLSRDGRKAYRKAKKNDNAYILYGNSICRVGANGKRDVVFSLPKTKVLVKKKQFEI